MSEYNMDISGKIELGDYSNIFDYFNVIEKDDNFIIRINKSSKDYIGVINTMLQDNKFNIKNSNYDELGNYYINAEKIE